jgi:hypothetical protein
MILHSYFVKICLGDTVTNAKGSGMAASTALIA